MPWMRHTLRDAQVWAEVDSDGRLVADRDGRVAVVYKREPGAKVYRAGSRNLGRVAGAAVESLEAGVATAPRPGGRGTRTTAASRPPGGTGQVGFGDPAPPGTVHVWTDGACSGNPGPAGVGVVVVDGDERREHGEYLGQGTNNIAELTAILRGLDMVADRARPVRIYTDSSYSIGVLSLGWKPKANRELIAEIKDRLDGFTDVRFVKVPGHAGVPENERCDALATGAIPRGRR